MKKTHSVKKHREVEARDEQEQTRNKLPKVGSNGLIGCQQKKRKGTKGRIK